MLDTNYVSDATISPCGRYRSHLSRMWDRNKEHALFIMLNPSTADALLDDPTIRRCIGFARAWGCGGVVVTNLFQLRATDPKELLKGVELNPPTCDETIDQAMVQTCVTIAAWGALHPKLRYRAGQLDKVAQKRGRQLHSLGVTKDGWPRHPLYLRNGLTPQLYFGPKG